MDPSTHYTWLAAAFARGRLGLPGVSDDEALVAAREAQLRLHRFKRNAQLPRVRKVLGVLQGLQPSSLLDVGAGRGTFLWPLLEAQPELSVTCVEHNCERADQVECVRAGGVDRLCVHAADVTKPLPFRDAEFDCVTVLEVMEHLERPADAARELVRAASRFIVCSVPSRPDDNPEHLRLYNRDSLTAMWMDAGAKRVRIDEVFNHYVAVIRV